jgi:mono/diheme cytochrome c family protein
MRSLPAVLALPGLSLALLVANTPATPAPRPDRKDVTYAADIKPIFDRNCVDCHGPKKAKSKIRLDSLELALKGNTKGKIIEPGDVSKGALVKAVTRVSKTPMPPKVPLPADQIALIRAWVEQGAK